MAAKFAVIVKRHLVAINPRVTARRLREMPLLVVERAAMDPDPSEATLYIGRSTNLASRHRTHDRRRDIALASQGLHERGGEIGIDIWKCNFHEDERFDMSLATECAEGWLGKVFGLGLFNRHPVLPYGRAADGAHERRLGVDAVNVAGWASGCGVYRWFATHPDGAEVAREIALTAAKFSHRLTP